MLLCQASKAHVEGPQLDYDEQVEIDIKSYRPMAATMTTIRARMLAPSLFASLVWRGLEAEPLFH